MQTQKRFSTSVGSAVQKNTRLEIITAGSILLCLVSFVLTTLLLLFYPYRANYGEAPILDQALRITAGQNIYKPILQVPPYVIANYTPIYPLLIGGFYHLTHLPLFKIGRAISILAAISSSLLLSLLARKLFNSPLTGLLAAALFLGHPFVSLWSGLVRVDSLALALSLAGVWITCTRWRSSYWLAIALLCLLASVFTRQTYLLAAPLACAVWLFHHNRMRGFTFMSLFVLLGFTTFLILNSVTHGGFYQHIVTANVNRYTLARTLSMGTLYFITAPVLFTLAAIAVQKASAHPFDPFITWGLLPYTAGALLTALTVGKVGSDINYFLELTAVSAIWAAGMWHLKPGRFTAILLVIHTVWTISFSGLLFQAPLVKMWNNISEIDILAKQVQIAAVKGPVLADDRLDLVVLAGQAIYYQPFEYTQLFITGIWNTEAFQEDISNQKFPLILIKSVYQDDCWPVSVYETIQKNYTCSLQRGIMTCHP